MKKVTVLQIEDRHQPLQDFLLSCTAEQSRALGLQYKFMSSGMADVPPYWWKVFHCLELLRCKDDAPDGVLWLDSDATLGRRDPRELLVDKKVAMWISPDAKPLYHSPFCAGTFLVRNNARGLAIMQYWASLFKRNEWDNTSGRWTTKGTWAGDNYEQGSFIVNILNRSPYRRWIRILPSYVLNETTWWNPHPRCVCIHLPGEYKPQTTRVFLERMWPSIGMEAFTEAPQTTTSVFSVVLMVALLIGLFFVIKRKD